MTRAFIAPLTGIRALAAMWVFLRHFRFEILDAAPWAAPALPFMSVGYLGVDLFFVLSGFILTVSYVERFAIGWSWRHAAGFLWLRIARIWPLTVFVLLIYGAYNFITAPDAASRAAEVNPLRFLAHATLTNAWFPYRLDWNGVDWSISAEWLAYLVFSIAVIGLVALLRVRRRAWLLVAAAFACAPIMLVGAATQDGTILVFSPDSYVLWPGLVALRVLCEFGAGALVALVALPYLNSIRTLPRFLRLWWPTILAAVAVIAVWFIASNDPSPWARTIELNNPHGWAAIGATETILVLPLFVALIFSLAVCSNDPFARLLASDPLVLGGKASYAFYLSHALAIGGCLLLARIIGSGAFTSWMLVVVTPILGWVFAWLLWRFIEEPARHALRRKLPARFTP